MATKKERTAIARIFADLIKADRIVDIGEMEFWEKVCESHGITREIHLAAKDMPFAEALETIQTSSDKQLKERILNECRDMTVSDGFCAHSEALIMSAIILKLEERWDGSVEVYSIPRSNFNIDVATMVYVESKYDPDVNEAIRSNYRAIFKELQLVGFHFIYLPQIIGHYHETEESRFKQILGFLAPDLSVTAINASYDSLINMTTESFCEDILCNKCSIEKLRHTYPSLLLKIGNSFVGDVEYANYLKIEVGEDILREVQQFVDSFAEMLSSDVFIVKTSEERNNQFHFFGFYKQLLEIFLITKNNKSNIIIEQLSSQIHFPGINAWLNTVNRRERALYLLLLCQGEEGLNFKKPAKTRMEAYHKRMEKYQKRFNEIYQFLGAESVTPPDLTKSTTRSPLITHLRTALNNLKGLYNPQDYRISEDSPQHFFVHVDRARVLVKPMLEEEAVPLLESEIYRRVMKI